MWRQFAAFHRAGFTDRKLTVGCLLVLSGLLSAEPRKPYAKFVLIPFHRAVDEVVFADVQAGKIKDGLPEWIRVTDGQVERRESRGGEWKPIKTSEDFSLFTSTTFGRDVAYYDNEGGYYLREDWYDRVKDCLPTNHKGSLHHFAKKDNTLKPEDGQFKIEVVDDPDLWDTFIWDDTDKCWRSELLSRMPADYKRENGSPLPAELPPAAIDNTTRLEDLVIEHSDLRRQWQIAKNLKDRKAAIVDFGTAKAPERYLYLEGAPKEPPVWMSMTLERLRPDYVHGGVNKGPLKNVLVGKGSEHGTVMELWQKYRGKRLQRDD